MSEEEKPPLDPHAKVCRNCCWWAPNQGAEILVTEDKKCFEPHQQLPWTDDEFSCEYFLGSDATEVNVPNHAPKGTMFVNNPNPVNGPVEILIVSFSKDFEWLLYALRSIHRYFTGFQGVTIAHPAHEAALFTQLHSIKYSFRLRLHAYDEVPGKGMLQHMAKMAQADQIVPNGTEYVLHTDSDGIFKMPSTPESFFWEDKPTYLYRTWSSLGVPDPRHPISKAVSDCGIWKAPTDAQLGWNTEFYTMCLNTQVFPIRFYQGYREHIERVHARPFEQYMVDGKNEFPQTKMDYTAFGAWAHKFMHDKFTWFDVENGKPYPEDRKKAFHSHSGFNPNIRCEIEALTT